MNKLKLFFRNFILILFGFILSLALFFPWSDVMELSFLKGSSMINDIGLDLKADSFHKEGIMPVFVVDGLSGSSFMGGIHVDSLKLKPRLFSSILSGSVVLDVHVNSARLELTGMVDKTFSGQFKVAYSSGGISVEDLNIRGDLSAVGDLGIDLKAKRISYSDVEIDVTDDMAAPMNSLRRFLPLKKDKKGNWLLYRKGTK